MMFQRTLLSLLTLLAFSACQPSGQNLSTASAPNTDSSGSVSNNAMQIRLDGARCEPMNANVAAGALEFQVHNDSAKALDWDIAQGVMVVAERAPIEAGANSRISTTLLAGEYTMKCGAPNNARAKLIVESSDFQPAQELIDMHALAQPLADYKTYVQAEVKMLVEKIGAFRAVVQAGKIEEAKAMFADVRTHYERIEPIAELFGDLDVAIDARDDDFKLGAKDPNFSGFHRIEYALWVEKSTDQVRDVAARLENDVKTLQQEIEVLHFMPGQVIGGAAELIEEVAGSKISGEENRYSHTDLADFYANMQGAQKIVDTFRAILSVKNPDLLKTIDEHFTQVYGILDGYKTAQGFEKYDQLSEADKKALQIRVNTLAEELAKLRGVLGVN